jgi:hypothetical protein
MNDIILYNINKIITNNDKNSINLLLNLLENKKISIENIIDKYILSKNIFDFYPDIIINKEEYNLNYLKSFIINYYFTILCIKFNDDIIYNIINFII